MTERSDVYDSIVATTADYREGDLPPPTSEHVDCWIRQFDEAVQLPILLEMDHVLKHTYFSRKGTKEFLAGLFNTEKLVGDDPCTFWKSVKFLDIQSHGASQKEIIALFSTVLKKQCGFEIADCGTDPHTFVYLDDAVFTGNRVRQDFETWITDNAPVDATVHIIAIALHSHGQNYAKGKIKQTARNRDKRIAFKWWRAIELEDQRLNTDSSDVLRPVAIPDDDLVKEYVDAMNYKPQLRTPGQVGSNEIFSSDEGRQLLEKEFLKAGVHIRKMCLHLNQYQRPLGNSVLETLGFGSLIVTFRNCPNNAPLALWAGDPWRPLFPRTTNNKTSLRRFMAMLGKDVV